MKIYGYDDTGPARGELIAATSICGRRAGKATAHQAFARTQQRLRAARYCYIVARAADNKPAATRHMQTIREELRTYKFLRSIFTGEAWRNEPQASAQN